jgi:hypothetical protein
MPVTEAISHHVIANAVKQSGFEKYEIATPLRELAMMFTEGFNDWHWKLLLHFQHTLRPCR